MSGGGDKLHQIGVPVDSWPWSVYPPVAHNLFFSLIFTTKRRDTHSSTTKHAVGGSGEDSLIGELNRAFSDTPHANPLLSAAQLRALRRRRAAVSGKAGCAVGGDFCF